MALVLRLARCQPPVSKRKTRHHDAKPLFAKSPGGSGPRLLLCPGSSLASTTYPRHPPPALFCPSSDIDIYRARALGDCAAVMQEPGRTSASTRWVEPISVVWYESLSGFRPLPHRSVGPYCLWVYVRHRPASRPRLFQNKSHLVTQVRGLRRTGRACSCAAAPARLRLSLGLDARLRWCSGRCCC